ncbi:MAG: hypothetical protein LBQ50_09365 [Planctomycetaceae bacterium]|jgi:hypothetical protein|nr:hypothetical protein [Planctomycetaceae bacterium]
MNPLRLILLPFDLLGQILSALGIFLWRIVGQLFLSPWGLIVPLTLLALLFLVSQLSQTSKQIAEGYAKELESCEEPKIPVLADRLVRLGEHGIPGLVRGLCSPREPVFIVCRDTLQNEMERWEQLPVSERLRQYRFLSAALLDQATKFGATARTETSLLAQKILRNLVVSKKSGSSDGRLVTRNCEQFLSLVETTRTKRAVPNDLVPAVEASEAAARFSRGPFDTTLMTAQGTPFQSDISGELQQETEIARNEAVDLLAVGRAERLYAYHQSPLFQKQFETPSRFPAIESLPNQTVPDSNRATEMLASMTRLGTSPALAESTSTLLAEPQGKVAGRYFSPETKTGTTRNGLEKNGSDHPLPMADDFSEETETLLPWELRELPLEKVSNLSSARLMRLLHHPDDRYVSEARKTLIARDGFQDIHLKLAYRLFHPVSSVRMEMISMLPNTHGVRSDVWLSVLLGDPDNDVRYRAASFLATAGDPAMQRLVIDKGKRDSDARIVNLADQLLEQQRHRVRR